MKKNILTMVLFFLIGISTNAQNLLWAKSMGGGSYGVSSSIALDAVGNVYSTGIFVGTLDFDPGVAVYNMTPAGSQDIYISKLDAMGNFVWAKQLGGTSNDQSQSITIDADGNVYTTGFFQGTADFDPGAAVYNLTGGGAFISKLDSMGNFKWAKQFLGTMGTGIAVDNSGNVFTTGSYYGTIDFDPGAGVYNLTGAGAFVSKLDSTGVFVWAGQMGGIDGSGKSIAVDGLGAVYTTGTFKNTGDFDPGAGVVNLVSAGSEEIFVSKLDASGNFVWAKSMGGTNSDFARSIAVDGSGNVYTTGIFLGVADFDPGAGVFNFTGGGGDIYVSKLDASGDFVWAKQIGNSSISEETYSIALDASSNVYIAGKFGGTLDFDPDVTVSNLNSAGGDDIFIAKLNTSGAFVWAVNMGSSGLDVGVSISLDNIGNVHATGYFSGTADFDPSAGVYNITALGVYDIFVLKLDNSIATGLSDEERKIENSIVVFPNPSAGLFTIIQKSVTPAEIEVYTVFGELVSKIICVNQQTSIDLSGQSKGIYFLKIHCDGQEQIAKIIIK